MTENWLGLWLAGENSHVWRKSPSILELESTEERFGGVCEVLSQLSFLLASVHTRRKIKEKKNQ